MPIIVYCVCQSFGFWVSRASLNSHESSIKCLDKPLPEPNPLDLTLLKCAVHRECFFFIVFIFYNRKFDFCSMPIRAEALNYTIKLCLQGFVKELESYVSCTLIRFFLMPPPPAFLSPSFIFINVHGCML